MNKLDDGFYLLGLQNIEDITVICMCKQIQIVYRNAHE